MKWIETNIFPSYYFKVKFHLSRERERCRGNGTATFLPIDKTFTTKKTKSAEPKCLPPEINVGTNDAIVTASTAKDPRRKLPDIALPRIAHLAGDRRVITIEPPRRTLHHPATR
jgi:hypothetical protein